MTFDTAFDLDQRLADLAGQLAGAPAPASAAAAMTRAEGLYAAVDRLEAAAATCVQAVDAAGEVRADGYPSTVAWLRESCRMLGSRASERVMIARQLRRLPETARRFTAGTLGYSAVKVLARVVKNLTDADTGTAEPILLNVADDLGPDAAAVVGRKIDDILHPDGKPGKKDEQFDRRWLKIGDLLDGMGSLDGVLDPELKNRLRAALDPLAKPAGDDDTRTTGQRYADALNALLSGGQQTHMNIVVNLETLTGGTEPGRYPDGSPISAEDARRIAANAGLSPILITGDGLPLDVGRESRLATTAQRIALRVRDGGCVVHGCTIPASWCEVDHITPWTLDGRTDLVNLALCCSFHNRFKARHPDRVHITDTRTAGSPTASSGRPTPPTAAPEAGQTPVRDGPATDPTPWPPDGPATTRPARQNPGHHETPEGRTPSTTR